jgi:hypothetical protein
MTKVGQQNLTRSLIERSDTMQLLNIQHGRLRIRFHHQSHEYKMPTLQDQSAALSNMK